MARGHSRAGFIPGSQSAPALEWSLISNLVGSPTYYTIDKVSHSETGDTGEHVWACQDTTYDEGRPGGVPTPDAGLALCSYPLCLYERV